MNGKARAARIDFSLQFEGNLVLFHIHTHAARGWVEENVMEPQYFGNALVVEGRFFMGLLEGMRSAGLNEPDARERITNSNSK